MPRRNSYLNSMDNPTVSSEQPPPSYGNSLMVPSLYGGSQAALSNGDASRSSKRSSQASTRIPSRNGSVASQAPSEKSSSSVSYSDYEEEPVKVRSPSPAYSEQFRHDAGWLLYAYTCIIGLNEGFFRSPRIRLANRIYCYVVIVLLFLGSFRRLQEIGVREPGLPPLSWGEAIFDPTIVLTICNAAFLLSGALAATFMLYFRGRRHFIMQTFKRHVKDYKEGRDTEKDARTARITVIMCIAFSFIASSMYKVKALKLPWLPPLITDHWYFWPFEFYLTFMAESAISVLTIFFSQSCNIIRHSIQSLLEEMLPGDHEDCPLPEESLRRIRDVQVHHQEILSAKTMLEDHFSFVLFYSYGVVIPAICFLGYLILKNITSDNWALHVSLAMWILTHMTALLMMSIPAFMIHEDGEKLLSASFKMYHEGLCEERDLLVVSQMTLLVFQIHSAKLTLSASNYFSMNRKILISLFSAIFTYFLILVQFGQTTSAGRIDEEAQPIPNNTISLK